MITLYYEKGLSDEAAFLAKTISASFPTEVTQVEAEKLEYLTQNEAVGGYEIREDVGQEFELVLTNKDLFTIGATSAKDDYVYGYCADSGLFYFSVARLKSVNDKPVEVLEVSEDTYHKRLAYIVVHEMGHWFVKDARHQKKYIYTNPDTGHQQDNGWHCTNDGCIMRAVDELVMLDQRSQGGDLTFCDQCRASLRIESGMPILPV